MTIYKCAVPRKWFDSSKDELAYVDNPVESDFPGHWLPISLIKRIMEMRVRSTTEGTNSNNKPLLFKKDEVSRQPLHLKKTKTPIRERTLMTTIKISTVPSSLKLTVYSTKMGFKDVNVQSTNSKGDASSPLKEAKVEVTTLSRGHANTTKAEAFSSTTEEEVSTNSKKLTSTATITTKIPSSSSKNVETTYTKNIDFTNLNLTTTEITAHSTTEIITSTSENPTNKTKAPVNTTEKFTTVTPQLSLTTTTSEMPTTTTETGNPFY
nr:flocculation protein FLO11-like [Vanessa tameamea]